MGDHVHVSRNGPSPAVRAPATPSERLAVQLLDQAEAYLNAGDLANALDSIDKAIACCDGYPADRTLRLIGSALTHPEMASDARLRSIRCFRRLEEAFPESVYGTAAQCWAAALNDVLTAAADIRKLREVVRIQRGQLKALEMQIEQLKAVDLEPPSNQPGINVP